MACDADKDEPIPHSSASSYNTRLTGIAQAQIWKACFVWYCSSTQPGQVTQPTC